MIIILQSSVKQLLRDNEEKLANHQKHLGYGV